MDMHLKGTFMLIFMQYHPFLFCVCIVKVVENVMFYCVFSSFYFIVSQADFSVVN